MQTIQKPVLYMESRNCKRYIDLFYIWRAENANDIKTCFIYGEKKIQMIYRPVFYMENRKCKRRVRRKHFGKRPYGRFRLKEDNIKLYQKHERNKAK
jgi:hypothetical protein